MFRENHTNRDSSEHFPRVSGDVPSTLLALTDQGKFSLRERGCS